MFNELASDGWTSAAAQVAIFLSKLSRGNSFGELLRPSYYSNRVIGWKPLLCRTVQPFNVSKVVRYRITPGNAPSFVLDRDDIIHLPSLGFDGLVSPSTLTYVSWG
ncbi:hypothetical protein [Massilia sp. METH4]|uniref:hypothetical protein n=1 Tax=Massilia sp. METH4 TaxID=3123041 RepID=UPI0030CAF655